MRDKDFQADAQRLGLSRGQINSAMQQSKKEEGSFLQKLVDTLYEANKGEIDQSKKSWLAKLFGE